MSVIIEDSKGQIWLLSKGAETSIMSKADSGPMKPTLKHIVDFALVIGARIWNKSTNISNLMI